MFENIDKKQALIAVAIVIGGALLVLLMRRQSQTTAQNGLGPSSGANALVGGYGTASTVYLPTTSYDVNYTDNSNHSVSTITTTTNSNNTTTTNNPVAIPQAEAVPTISTGQATGSTVNPAPAASPSFTVPTSGGRDHNYAPITIQGATTTETVQTALANPGSPIHNVNPQAGQSSYEIAKAGINGKLVVASSYNDAVNKSGGQWIDHQFFSGHYDSSGKFVTGSAANQARYNSLVPANKTA